MVDYNPLTHLNNFDNANKFHLHAAQGWLELGNHVEANAELENITPELRAHPDVLEVRLEIFSQGKLWVHCIEVANTLITLQPQRANVWIKRSFALHELKHTLEAYDQLLPAATKFPKLWVIPYNLACYCAQLGRMDEAKVWFQKAMTIDAQTVKCEAIDDPDLKPLWDSMSGTLWRRE